jgi:predicted DNA-binding transcriptional regulator YafY
MAYEKTYDLLDLAIWMQSNREGVSLGEIAERFNVSRRTAERMRDMIITRFPQTEEIVELNNVKRWYIPQGTLRDFIQFSAEELSVLETAQNLFKNHHLQEQEKIFGNVIQKVKASIKSATYRKIEPDCEALMEAEGFICRPGPKLKINREIIATIKQAILECHQINITYQNKLSGKKSHNILDPYGFLYGERNHYLVAHHSDGYFGDNVHNFILANIEKVDILPKTFVPIKGFNLQKYAELSFGAFHEEPFDVEWLFDKDVASEAAQYIFHPTQKLTFNPDGTLSVSFTAGGWLEMDWHLYTWGSHVKVIKPENWEEDKFSKKF